MAQIASPGEVLVPGVMCARCGQTFSVRVQYSIRAMEFLPARDGVVDVPLSIDILDVGDHSCAPPIRGRMGSDL